MTRLAWRGLARRAKADVIVSGALAKGSTPRLTPHRRDRPFYIEGFYAGRGPVQYLFLATLGRLIARYPSTAIYPVLLLAVILGVGVWGINRVARADEQSAKMQASSLVNDAALSFRQQLSIAAGPVYTLSALVHYNPNFDAVSAVFRSSFASEVARQASGMRSLQLSPYGVIRLVYPLEGNTGALGLDIFATATDGASAVQTVKEGKLTLVGPLPFRQGGSGVRVSVPIYIGNTTANTSFGGPDLQNPRCGAACYNEATGSKFWGFATVLIDLDALYNGTDSRLRSLEDRGFAYELVAPLGASRVTNLTVLARSSGRRPSDDAVSATIELPNNQWILRLSPASGSWQPSWYPPVLAGLVVLAVVVCGLQFVVLVSRRQHQMLLEALLPRELIEDLVTRDTASMVPRVMQTDTPADTLLKMMGCLLEGGAPDLRDVLFLRTTVLRNLDIYQPLNLRGHIKGANLDADVTRALMRQLGGSAGGDESDSLYDNLPNDAAALAAQLYDTEGGGEGKAGAAAAPHECDTLQGALALILTASPAGWYDPGGYDAADAMSDAALPGMGAGSSTSASQHMPVSAPAQVQVLREAQAAGSACEGGGGRQGAAAAMPSGAGGRGGGACSGTFRLPTPPCRQASTGGSGEVGAAAYGSAAVDPLSATADPDTAAGPPATGAASLNSGSIRLLLAPSATGAFLHPKKRSLVVTPSGGSQLVLNGAAAAAAPPSPSGMRSINLSGSLPAFEEALQLGRAGGGGGGAGGGGLLQTRMARRQAALPPPPAIIEEVERLLSSADCWQFDMWRLREATQGHPLSSLGFFLMQRQGLIARFRLDPVKLARLLRHIEAGYPDNPYHNATHAADVLQTLHVIIHGGQLHVHYLDPLGLLAAYFAAIIHDYGHPGLTNDFLIATHHPLAIRYNDRSPLENHHAAAAFAVLRRPELDVLAPLSPPERASFRKQVLEMVLATDMKQHFALLGHFNTVHRLGAVPDSDAAAARPAAALANGSRKHMAGTPAGGAVSTERTTGDETAPKPKDDQERLLGLQLAMKAADLGHLGEELSVHQKWLSVLEEEFFRQGDREQQLGLPISPLFDRAKQGVGKSQVGFYDFVVMPLVHALSGAFPGTSPLMRSFASNYNHWRTVDCASSATPAAAATTAATAAATAAPPRPLPGGAAAAPAALTPKAP